MKVKAMIIGAFAGLAAIAAISGTAIYLTKGQNNSSFSNSFTGKLDDSAKAEIIGNNFNLTIQRHAATSEEVVGKVSDEVEYTIQITQDEKSKEQGYIFFIAEDKEKEEQSITFKPGDTIKVGVKLLDDQSGENKLTIRDLLVWGANDHHFVSTQKEDDGTYSIKMPKVDEQKNQDGSDWLYGEGVKINVKATFIKESIGKDTKWTHGAYFGDLNGYVYNLKEDANWSGLKDTIYTAFKNEDISNPIDVYVFLNGFSLTIDEKIEDKFIPSGWALHLHNNGKDSATEDGKFGKIKAGSDATQARIDLKGSIYLGRSVEYNMIPTTTGVAFLNTEDLQGWIGVNINNPNEQK